MTKTPLTTSQTMLLAILRKARHATTAQLAAATERADRDVLASLHRLEDRGLIERAALAPRRIGSTDGRIPQNWRPKE